MLVTELAAISQTPSPNSRKISLETYAYDVSASRRIAWNEGTPRHLVHHGFLRGVCLNEETETFHQLVQREREAVHGSF